LQVKYVLFTISGINILLAPSSVQITKLFLGKYPPNPFFFHSFVAEEIINQAKRIITFKYYQNKILKNIFKMPHFEELLNLNHSKLNLYFSHELNTTTLRIYWPLK